MASYKFFKGLVSLCVLFSVSSASYEIKPQGKNQQRVSMMKICIDIDGTQQPLFATLAITPTVEDFAKQLPLTLTLKDYDATEKIADLPNKLTTQSSPHGYAGKAGDLTYYAPWGNLAFFYKDSAVGYANGLIFLGKLDAIPQAFKQKQPIKISISQIE
ncbi:cyclophilin-like fold protein [Acinetobacter sp. XS-4]|uniref:cyclophilin-like fold protein n=1 Tax=Acinetobacter sp. XS-4 TaxID=2923375 RepID=UPI00208F046F|nr:cyclophilin-like fold protein [Acinetobacter sp. XS-4]USP39111.1 cyclophilin-like fold protein [Acinetobacter sp. XS-4]